MLRSNRHAFTLIELVVVILITATLFALLLPAVQRARQSALQTRCANQLKQIGLGLHGYDTERGSLPPGCSYRGWTDPMPHVTWMTRLLPYLGHDSLWQQVQAAFAANRFFESPPHLPILGRAMPEFACPADPRSGSPHELESLRVGLSSYLGVSGTDQTRRDGMLFLDSRVRLIDVTDGTANTLMVGERPPSADGVFGWWYAGWGQSRDGSCDSVLGVREHNVHPLYIQCPPGPFHFGSGQVNGLCDMFHYWSLHPGGSHFVFADGSLRFLSYSADPVFPAMATRGNGDYYTVP